MAKIRVNMNFEEEILKKVDEEAKYLGVSRTACISMMVGQYLQQKKVLEVGGNMLGYIKSQQTQEEQIDIFDQLESK